MLRGGVADKFGNGYEAAWTLLQTISVLRGEAQEIRLEPVNEDAAGLEFRVTTGAVSEWHQCKRRRSSGSWTLNALGTAGVLEAFARKLANPADVCVFISMDPAEDLRNLIAKAELAQTQADFDTFLNQDDQVALEHLKSAWAVDHGRAHEWLGRCRVETVSDQFLEEQAMALAGLLFTMDPEQACERLLRFLDREVTHRLTTEGLRNAVDQLGLGWQARLDPTLADALSQGTETYLLKTLARPIAGVEIATPDIETAVTSALEGEHRLTILSGGAGSGKSTAVARIVRGARARGWPVLGLRVDRFLDAKSTAEIGTILTGRNESPVALLGNGFPDQPRLLVLDQIDAVSEVSGRSARMREMVFELIELAAYYPQLKVVIACRTYDLENDGHIKALEREQQAASVRLNPLDWTAAVQPVLVRLGLGEREFSDRQKAILGVAVNLQTFVTLVEAGEPVEGDLSGGRLFDSLLTLRARELRNAGIGWTPQAALGAMAAWMSDNQSLAAPDAVLSPFAGATDALGSCGLISVIGGKLQFAHESYFDHVFSADFAARGGSVLALLTSDEQRLFRRTQVRQIFTRLRDQGGRRYLSNLREVMGSATVRYLVKDAIAAWLNSLEDPSEAEFKLVLDWYADANPLQRLGQIILNGRGWLPPLMASKVFTQWIDQGGDQKTLALWLLRKSAVSHAPAVCDFLRDWWGGRPDGTRELRTWFSELYADGPLGPLEDLYREVIAATPPEALERKFEENFDLGRWTHNDFELGARVLGYWLRRWMDAFPAEHPFERMGEVDQLHWFRELSLKVPIAFMEAVWPVLTEALDRDRKALAGKRIDYPTLRLPFRGQDTDVLVVIASALGSLAQSEPGRVIAWLDDLTPIGEVAVWLHLLAIKASGMALHPRLLGLLDAPDLLNLGEEGDKWRPFAEAARASFPHLDTASREAVEQKAMAHRPEVAWLRQLVADNRGPLNKLAVDPQGYIRHVRESIGETERAILTTIGREALSDRAAKRLAELDRKFPGKPLPEAYGIRGGMVRSPISGPNAKLMGDAAWLRAMRRWSGEDRTRFKVNDAIGGSRELAQMLAAQVKDAPERFVALLEQMPKDSNAAYPIAILDGLRESDCDSAQVSRAFRAARAWNGDDFARSLSWLVERVPQATGDPEILAAILDIAIKGSASDTAVRTTSPKPKASVAELLGGRDDLESSGMNGNRGAAYIALRGALWADEDLMEPVTDLLERQIADEPLTSVRMYMLPVINAVLKHDIPRGLDLFARLARRDTRALLSRGGRHLLRWASPNHPERVQTIIADLAAAQDEGLKALGLLTEGHLALIDDDRDAAFTGTFAGDSLRRRVAGFLAGGNLGVDQVGERASRWLPGLYDDPDPEVRREASATAWDQVLQGTVDRSELALTFVRSRAFEDNADRITRALDAQIDRFPELAFATVTRLLDVQAERQAKGLPDPARSIYRLSGLLVALYRAFEGDTEKEGPLLDLFDRYLMSDDGRMQREIDAYERH